MPYPINAYATQDAYTAAGESVFSTPRKSFTLVVLGAQVFYSLGVTTDLRATAVAYQAETQIPPGRYSFDETDADAFGGAYLAKIKIRSAVTGLSATVYVM